MLAAFMKPQNQSVIHCSAHSPQPEPVWRPEYSFRNQPYRHLHHQNSISGHLVARVLKAVDIPLDGIGSRSGSSDTSELPYVNLNVSKCWKSSAPASRSEPCLSWSREVLYLEVIKGTLHAGEPVTLEVQACRRCNFQIFLCFMIANCVSCS
jgi:hypothetical protein